MPKMVNLHWIKPPVRCGLKIVAFILNNGKLSNNTLINGGKYGCKKGVSTYNQKLK